MQHRATMKYLELQVTQRSDFLKYQDNSTIYFFKNQYFGA
jgi:hypothetical protein